MDLARARARRRRHRRLLVVGVRGHVEAGAGLGGRGLGVHVDGLLSVVSVRVRGAGQVGRQQVELLEVVALHKPDEARTEHAHGGVDEGEPERVEGREGLREGAGQMIGYRGALGGLAKTSAVLVGKSTTGGHVG